MGILKLHVWTEGFPHTIIKTKWEFVVFPKSYETGCIETLKTDHIIKGIHEF